MTAEIAILNKRGIALAADSAATFSTSGATKIKPTAEKIFALSNCQPVGIMIFGAAEFVGYPWDILIKSYRDEALKSNSYGRLQEYCEDFERYLVSRTDLFTTDVQLSHIRGVLLGGYRALIRTFIEPGVKRTIRNKGKATTRDVRSIVTASITRLKSELLKQGFRQGYDLKQERQIAIDLSKEIQDSITVAFAKLTLSQSDMKDLVRIACMFVSRTPYFNENSSGVVFAGYGVDEYLPHLTHKKYMGIFHDKLRIVDLASRCVTIESDALVMPFAQGEMVHTVMEGVNPEYQRAINADIDEVIDIIINESVNHLRGISGISQSQIAATNSFASSLGDQAKKAFATKLSEFRRENFVSPILSIVRSLDKADLAEMALTLVNLTSFKRRVSTDEETVGGPVDVAIISKNDGFIWKERKLYFDSALNPRYMSRY